LKAVRNNVKSVGGVSSGKPGRVTTDIRRQHIINIIYVNITHLFLSSYLQVYNTSHVNI